MLDFIGASSYYADMTNSPVALGPDGNLIHEFMEIERIMIEQSQSIGSSAYTQGSYQPYVCRVAGKIGNMGINHECLDIASPKTMSVSSQNVETGVWNVSYTSTTGQLAANQFVHTNVMVDINSGVSSILPSDVMDLFGSNVSDCDSPGGKIMGDGVINSFDLYVLASAQFLQGPYASFRNTPFAAIQTVQGRPDTKDRCCIDNQDCPLYDRLDWQQRVAYKDCFAYRNDEGSYLTSLPGRRMQADPFIATLSLPRHGLGEAYSSSIPTLPLHTAIPPTIFKMYASRPEVHEKAAIVDALAHHKEPPLAQGIYSYDIQSRPTTHGWSQFEIYTPFNSTHVQPVRTITTLQPDVMSASEDAAYSTKDMRATIMEYSVTSVGTWYWINVPSVHIALELSISSIGTHEGIAISNERAPNYMERLIPHNPSKINLRFARHREFYGLDTSECAPVSSSRRSSNAMENGVIYVGQTTTSGSKLCGFDLLVWKPHTYAPVLTHESLVCVLSGSVGMDGIGGSMQRSTSCVTTLPPATPPLSPAPLLPAPPPPTTQVPPVDDVPPSLHPPSSSSVGTLFIIITVGILAAIAAALSADVFTMSTNTAIAYNKLNLERRVPCITPKRTLVPNTGYDRPRIAFKLFQ